MRYTFYGQNIEINYNPFIADYFGCKVPSLGKCKRILSWDKFYSKDNVHTKIEKGQHILINNESIYMKDVQYDIANDEYKCYTEKVLSEAIGNMNERQAEYKLEKLNKGFFSKLFGL